VQPSPIGLLHCAGCEVPLLTHLTLDRQDARHAFRMAQAAGVGYALNVCRDGACPVCGSPVGWPGHPPPELGPALACERVVDESVIEGLKDHVQRHVRSDWGHLAQYGHSTRYLLAYSALRHLVLFGTVVTDLGPGVGLTAILSDVTSRHIFGYLVNLVERESGQPVPPGAICAHAYRIRGGTCVVVQLPPPKECPDPYFLAILTADDPTSSQSASLLGGPGDPVVLSLERGEDSASPLTMLGHWTTRGRKGSYGFGPAPTVPNLVECAERLWVSEMWQGACPIASG
jgi:hypothetical protein